MVSISAIFNCILLSYPLVLLSNLDLRGFCFRGFFVYTHINSINQGMPVIVEDLLRVAEVDTSNPHDFNGKEQDLSISKLSSAAFNITLLLPHGPRTPKEGIS